MYTIKLIDTIIHDERTVFVEQPVLTRKLNKAGTLTFTITKDNPGYELILPRIAQIYVYRYGTEPSDLLWSGVVLTYRINLYGEMEVTCEGTLALLNDVYCEVSLYTVYPRPENFNLKQYLSHLKFEHNSSERHVFAENTALYLPKQSFEGRMHLYVIDDTQTFELFSGSGVTAEEISNTTVYIPGSDWSGIELFVSHEGGTGNELPVFKIGNAYSSQHELTPYVAAPAITSQKEVDVCPYTSTKIPPHPDVVKLNIAVDFRSIANINSIVPTIGNIIVLTKAFKDSFCSTAEKINKIIERFGGMVKAYATDYKGMIIDYHESFTETCRQKITLGDNLEDYMEDINFDGIYNRLIPFGKNKGTSFLWDYVTIESVNKNRDYIDNGKSIAIYGKIQRVIHYNDVEDPAELLRLANIELENSQDFELSVSVKAVDKSMIDVDKQAFDIGLLTEITIPPLNITRNLICTSIVNHLSEPEKDEYTFGSIPQTSTSYVASGNTSGTTSSGSDIAILSTSGSVSSQFNLLNSEVYRIGDCVFVSLKLKNEYSMSAGNSKVCYTLPAGYHPTKEANIMAAVNTNNCVTGWIRTNGEIVVLSNYAMAVGTEIRVMAYFYMEV